MILVEEEDKMGQGSLVVSRRQHTMNDSSLCLEYMNGMTCALGIRWEGMVTVHDHTTEIT